MKGPAREGYSGVVLAAGFGRRMGGVGERIPKCLVPIERKPLIHHHIEMLRDAGIRHFVVVVGHLGDRVKAAVGDGSQFGVEVEYVVQDERGGIAHALSYLQGVVHTPFLLTLGDIFFVARDIDRLFDLFEIEGRGAVLAAKWEPDLDAVRRNYTVEVGADDRVVRVEEKPQQPRTHLKGVGLYLFDTTVFDTARRTPISELRGEQEITHTIQMLVDEGAPVRVARAVDHDINLTNPTDVLRCNLWLAESDPELLATPQDARIHPGARIESTVMGKNCEVVHPIRLSNCLVFDDVRIASERDLDHQVLLPGFSADCEPLRPDKLLPDVSIVIVNRNAENRIDPCLDRVAAAAEGLETELIFVDNASSDQSVFRVQQRRPDAIVLRQPEDRGYVRGANIGLESATGRHILFLNTAALMAPDALRLMVEYADSHPDVGVISGQILNPDGSDQGCARAFPSPANGLFGRRSILTRWFPNNRWSKAFMLSRHRHDDEPFDCEILSSACLLSPTPLAKEVGGMDESFSGAWVDAELCQRISRNSGARVVCVPKAKIVHDEAETRKRLSTTRERVAATIAFHRGAYIAYTKIRGGGFLGWRRFVAAVALGSRGLVLAAAEVALPTRWSASDRRH